MIKNTWEVYWALLGSDGLTTKTVQVNITPTSAWSGSDYNKMSRYQENPRGEHLPGVTRITFKYLRDRSVCFAATPRAMLSPNFHQSSFIHTYEWVCSRSEEQNLAFFHLVTWK